ncbi:MAG: transglutaminaseTgpA domain-containing protein [Planctomycetota bacterium]
MDQKRIKSLRLNMTAHFAVIAWLTAMLVASGSGTFFLPMFIFVVSIVAFVLVDYLELFELKSVASAIGMTIATAIAIATYVVSAMNESESGQLLAVAGLLVYPEAVLFMQRKNLRIFEQLAVFLLLEMIVAALVNDNILFGLLLAPIVMIWVSSLFLFSRYATLVKIDPTIETQQPKLAEVLFKRFVVTVLGQSKRSPIAESEFLPSSDVQGSRTFRRALQSIPIGLGAVVFAGFFFYLVPRTGSGGFGSAFNTSTAIGLPDQLTFGKVGRILKNPAQVMRVTLKEDLTGEKFKPDSPPYLRAKVFDYYGIIPGSNRGRGEWKFVGQSNPRALGSRFSNQARERPRLAEEGRQQVLAEFRLKREYASELYSMPPIFKSKNAQNVPLTYDEIHMVLQKLDNTGMSAPKSVGYDVVSLGFRDRTQLRVTPATLSLNPRAFYSAVESNRDRLTRGFTAYFNGRATGKFQKADAYRKEILRKSFITEEQKFAAAIAFENHLAFSGEFGYTLDIKPPLDSGIDPIEDFIVNQKMGHCQYFATAMVCFLRQSGIPSRLVIGYRPTEYNSIGDYFQVRQKDAHAWVEALFSHEELEGTSLQDQRTSNRYYWVRFDPTPPPDGELSITDQDGQAIDYAEKLWQDYVVEGQQLSGENSIYAPVAESEEAYAELVERLKRVGTDLTSGRFLTGEFGVMLPIAIVCVALILGCVVIWQGIKLLPKFSPKWARRLGIVRSEMQLTHPFYARCLQQLQKLGIRRAQSMTPKEFTDKAQGILREKGVDAQDSLGFLTSLYYRLRFGGERETPDERAVNERLKHIEQAVNAAKAK